MIAQTGECANYCSTRSHRLGYNQVLMPYLIDGHNLVPKIPGLSLKDVDDEIQLIELLQEFCRLSRKRVEVYFDNAPPGSVQVRRYGLVTTHFVRQGRTADDAIRVRLSDAGKKARNWTVVSSDTAVQSASRYAGAQTTTAEDFADLLLQTLQQSSQDEESSEDNTPSPEEISYWLDLFGTIDE